MGRSKRFDREEALEKAALLFWEHGYEKTSLHDLLERMEMPNGSFYYNFKDKANLYLEALKHYNATITNRRLLALEEGGDLGSGLKKMFDLIIDIIASGDYPTGCMMTNSMSEETLVHEEIKRYVHEQVEGFHAYLERRIAAEIESGRFSCTASAGVIASLLVTYLQGLFKLSDLGWNPERLREQTALFLSALELG